MTTTRPALIRKALQPNGLKASGRSRSTTSDEQSLSATANGRRSSAHTYRSHTMHLLMEELSRDRMRQTQRDLEAIRMARRLRSTRKQRRSSRHG